MGDSLQKIFLGVIALSVSCIAVGLVPVFRKAAYWNRCVDSTLAWIDEAPDLDGWSKKAKDSLAVGVCNGAVYESKLINGKSQSEQ